MDVKNLVVPFHVCFPWQPAKWQRKGLEKAQEQKRRICIGHFHRCWGKMNNLIRRKDKEIIFKRTVAPEKRKFGQELLTVRTELAGRGRFSVWCSQWVWTAISLQPARHPAGSAVLSRTANQPAVTAAAQLEPSEREKKLHTVPCTPMALSASEDWLRIPLLRRVRDSSQFVHS